MYLDHLISRVSSAIFSDQLQRILGAKSRVRTLFQKKISRTNHTNYNFLDCDWFKKLLFSTNLLAKLFNGQFVIGQFNKPIIFKVVV